MIVTGVSPNLLSFHPIPIPLNFFIWHTMLDGTFAMVWTKLYKYLVKCRSQCHYYLRKKFFNCTLWHFQRKCWILFAINILQNQLQKVNLILLLYHLQQKLHGNTRCGHTIKCKHDMTNQKIQMTRDGRKTNLDLFQSQPQIILLQRHYWNLFHVSAKTKCDLACGCRKAGLKCSIIY